MPRLGDVAKGAAPLLEAAEAVAQPRPRSVPCRGCETRIFFVQSPHGRLMPVDERQTTILVPGVTPEEPWRLVKGHVPHHITCPNRDRFRKK